MAEFPRSHMRQRNKPGGSGWTPLRLESCYSGLGFYSNICISWVASLHYGPMKLFVAFLWMVGSLRLCADAKFVGPLSLAGPLIVSGNGVYVAPPIASFAISTNAGVPTLSVTFTDTSVQSPTAWDWDFGDGSAHSSSTNPSHTGFYFRHSL